MKLIIDIPKRDYKLICNKKEDVIIAHDTCRRIANGIPLEEDIEALGNQKTGHWIKREIEDTLRWKECSECHSEYPNMNGLNYCPNCGAKMEGETNGRE